jgi:hypothetical protein
MTDTVQRGLAANPDTISTGPGEQLIMASQLLNNDPMKVTQRNYSCKLRPLGTWFGSKPMNCKQPVQKSQPSSNSYIKQRPTRQPERNCKNKSTLYSWSEKPRFVRSYVDITVSHLLLARSVTEADQRLVVADFRASREEEGTGKRTGGSVGLLRGD